jgi:hypothetical protein
MTAEVAGAIFRKREERDVETKEFSVWAKPEADPDEIHFNVTLAMGRAHQRFTRPILVISQGEDGACIYSWRNDD